MKILYVAYSQQNSSISSANSTITQFPWVNTLLNEMAKYGNFTIALAVPVDGDELQKNQKDGITLYGLPNPQERNIFKQFFDRLTGVIEKSEINSYLNKIICDFEPDIIEIFGSENPFGMIAKEQSKPVIIHIQGYLLVCLGKWFAGMSKCQQFRYSSFKNILLYRGIYHGYYIFKKRAEREAIILKNCKYFLGRTSFDKRIVKFFSPDSTYFHCEEFIRKEFFEKQWNLPLQNEITCVSVLKGTSYKGIDLLVEALLILRKQSTLTFKFKICGVSDDEEIVKFIKKKFKKEINSINIKFLGRLSTGDLIMELCSSNFYLHPSYIENSPNSVCEAMVLGMPIISTNVGGVSSLIHDRIEGILVQEGEPYSLVAAINELINNYEYANLIGINARRRAIQRHDPNEIVKRLNEIYDTILYKK